MKTLLSIPVFADLSDDELAAWIEEAATKSKHVSENAAEYAADFAPAELLEAATELVAKIEEAKDELSGRQPEVAEVEEVETVDVSDELAALADRAQVAADEAAAVPETLEVETLEVEEPETPEDEPETPEDEAAVEPVVASAVATRRRVAPSRSRRSAPVAELAPRVSLTAAAEGLGFALGAELGQTEEEAAKSIARMMIRRRQQFGSIPEGTHGDTVPIARAEWAGDYPEDRRLGDDLSINYDRIAAVTASAAIKREFDARVKKEGAHSLVASGGLCAPVTPYYGLQMLSVADRPVRAALPSFNADRGGINAASPASLSAIEGGVGVKTMAEDAAGGSAAVKTCQVVDCPPFTTTEIEAIYHCLQFGNVGVRTFPELLEQWNGLVLAAHARVAESGLLDGIDAASTQITAASGGLGASATLPSQIITAAISIRSRNRMSTDAVLRVLLPFWVLDLLVSDVYRSQFQRFDITPEQFVAILRRHNIEPSFYMDTATGKDQIFGAQGDASLLPFPSTITWYLYPEGSFLYLDNGTLELGLVRDSVLNSTNDFQIFGETFEAVAFVGIESYAVTSTTCDSGAVSAPVEVDCADFY